MKGIKWYFYCERCAHRASDDFSDQASLFRCGSAASLARSRPAPLSWCIQNHHVFKYGAANDWFLLVSAGALGHQVKKKHKTQQPRVSFGLLPPKRNFAPNRRPERWSLIVQLGGKKTQKLSSKNEVYLHLYTHRAHRQAHIHFAGIYTWRACV